MAYVTADKVGLQIMPLDGNPHKSAGLIAHPHGVSRALYVVIPSYLFLTLYNWPLFLFLCKICLNPIVCLALNIESPLTD